MELLIETAMEVALEAAQSAGAILRDMLQTASVREKAPKDLVTDADIAAQNCIEGCIHARFPNHLFLGEESSRSCLDPLTVAAVDWLWVVDPLDGTVNYVHRLPNFAVSIALMHRGKTVLGVVFDPMAEEMYKAVLGHGSRVNGHVLKSSRCARLDQALVAASFPPAVQKNSVEVKQFVEVLVRSQSMRRLGSAALNLCYVAQGRLDAYWAGFLKVWDIAAGALIATEAGASLMSLDGSPFNPWDGRLIAAGTDALCSELFECLHAVEFE